MIVINSTFLFFCNEYIMQKGVGVILILVWVIAILIMLVILKGSFTNDEMGFIDRELDLNDVNITCHA